MEEKEREKVEECRQRLVQDLPREAVVDLLKRNYNTFYQTHDCGETGKILDGLKSTPSGFNILLNLCEKTGKTHLQAMLNSKKQSEVENIQKISKVDYITVVIVCTKRYEMDSVAKVLRDYPEYFGNISTPLEEGNLEQNKFLYQTWNFEKSKLRLIVATFQDLQGPVVAATRTVQVILQCKPEWIGMIGVCGGRKLGKVLIAKKAVDPFYGRVIESSDLTLQLAHPESTSYRYKYEEVEDVTVHQLEGQDLRTFAEAVTKKFSYEVEVGTLFMANQVREDLELLLPKLNKGSDINHCGIDMESAAFYQAARMLKCKVLPVIKGISDVGRELHVIGEITDAESKLKFHNVAEFERVRQSSPTSHVDARKAYRQEAAARAARVMIEYIYRRLNNGTL